jgi:cytochrome c
MNDVASGADHKLRTLVLWACAMLIALVAFGAETEADRRVASKDEIRATALLERAVDHVTTNGEAGVADFSRQAEFVDRDLYVFALHTDGRLLASGGASAAMIGENVIAQTDLAGRPFLREMLQLAQAHGEGRIEYRWFNPADSRGEPKLALFRKVGEIIVAVGFYPPRATPFEAKGLLDDAVKALRADKAIALSDFQQLGGRFLRDDLYVFVVDISDGRILAHGASPRLVGTSGHEVRDPHGRAIVTDMISVARKDGEGEIAYSWRNPSTDRIESKRSFFRPEGGLLVGVGHYSR